MFWRCSKWTRILQEGKKGRTEVHQKKNHRRQRQKYIHLKKFCKSNRSPSAAKQFVANVHVREGYGSVIRRWHDGRSHRYPPLQPNRHDDPVPSLCIPVKHHRHSPDKRWTRWKRAAFYRDVVSVRSALFSLKDPSRIHSCLEIGTSACSRETPKRAPTCGVDKSSLGPFRPDFRG